MLTNCFNNVKSKHPLIHNITNYVTVNDCANILLACGGSPIMSDDINEVEEITSICNGLNINIGTLNERTIKSMIIAGKKSNELNHPVLLDPVGAGASKLRTETAKQLINEIKFTVIRGNISEIKTLADSSSLTMGVDANDADKVNENTLDFTIEMAKALSLKTGAIIAISGETDIIADKNKAYVIKNGVSTMSLITGTGCMLSALTTAYITANKENTLEATAAAFCAMGICGEKAHNTMIKNNAGTSSFRNYLIDEIYKLDGQTLDTGAKYEIR